MVGAEMTIGAEYDRVEQKSCSTEMNVNQMQHILCHLPNQFLFNWIARISINPKDACAIDEMVDKALQQTCFARFKHTHTYTHFRPIQFSFYKIDTKQLPGTVAVIVFQFSRQKLEERRKENLHTKKTESQKEVKENISFAHGILWQNACANSLKIKGQFDTIT